MLKSAKSLIEKAKRPGKAEEPAGEQLLQSRIAQLNVAKPVTPEPQRSAVETRIAERFVPQKRNTVLTSASGKKLGARIINLSSVSVAIEADFAKMKPQEVHFVGSRRVLPGRRIMLGWVFMFEKPLGPKSTQPDVIL